MQITHTLLPPGPLSAPRISADNERPPITFAATLGNAIVNAATTDSENGNAAPNAHTRRPGDEPPLFFPPNFPPEMKERLTELLSNSSLSGEEKNALWATSVVSIDLMNNGPAEFRRLLGGDAQFGSENFDPLRLLENFVAALAAKYPRIGEAVNDYLSKKSSGIIDS